MLTLETERLLLRPLNSGDFEAVQAYASVPENVTYMIWGPNGEEDTRAFLRRCEECWNENPIRKHEFAVVLKSSEKVIGACGIYLAAELNQAMLGWILHRDYWKQGFMPEAAGELLRFGFETLKLHRIYATCNAENYGSYRVMEKIGMRREAYFRKNRYGRVGGRTEWFDEYYYGILEEEWKNLLSQV